MKRIIGLIVLAAIIVGGYLGYQEFFGGEEPKAVSLASSAPSGGPVDFNGTWTVDRTTGTFDVQNKTYTSTWAGYRINEVLAQFGHNTAVGRTRNVTGSMTIAAHKITAATFTVDMQTLESDRQQRDGAIGHRGLETSTYPTAEFKLSEPITISSEPKAGENISTQATGNFTLHGVTKKVTIPISARYSNGVTTVVSNFPVKLADYDITPPAIPGKVVSVEDSGRVELHLLLKKS